MASSGNATKEPTVVNNFTIPSWAGKPIEGLHIDVMKDTKIIQKLMIDEKRYYFFGRNRQMCDFAVDHESCSRCHAVLLWHKALECLFLIDLGSVHGTYIGKIRLESNTPQKVPVGSEIHFGASTRLYVIREKPRLSGISGEGTKAAHQQVIIGPMTNPNEDPDESALNVSGSLLPETEYELDNLTKFNTAHNCRISNMINLGIVNLSSLKRTKNKFNVHFNDHDEVINPEDVDPSIGKFRNLVEQSFVPNKRSADTALGAGASLLSKKLAVHSIMVRDTTADRLEDTFDSKNLREMNPGFALAAKLGLPLPNLAPDLSEGDVITLPSSITALHAHANNKTPAGPQDLQAKQQLDEADVCPKKKKYVKEAWPGKAPSFMPPVGPAV